MFIKPVFDGTCVAFPIAHTQSATVDYLDFENMNLEGLSDRDRAVLRSIFDPTVTIGDVADESDAFLEDDDEPSESCLLSRELCVRGVKLAEEGKLAEALQLIEEGVSVAPERPAGYNDRAQLLRIMQRDDEALLNIEKAINLTEGKKSRARAQALCQRGVMLRKKGRDDEARTDFSEAAKLGSAFAKKQVVEMNPYAALCNKMLTQVIKGATDVQL